MGYIQRNIQSFHYLVCEQGDVIYSSNGPVKTEFCRLCGSPYLVNCSECNTPLSSTFNSPIYLSSGKPKNVPKPPGACSNCGKIFPWTHNIERPLSKNEAIRYVLRCCEKFHLISKKIRQRYDDRGTLDVNDEYDVQDLMNVILSVYFDDIRREEYTPSYAGGSSRMDFLIKDYSIVLELKKTRKGLNAKEIGSQLIEDIAKYKNSQDCKTLICFIYDPDGRIHNPEGLIKDLEKTSNDIAVKVLISP